MIDWQQVSDRVQLAAGLLQQPQLKQFREAYWLDRGYGELTAAILNQSFNATVRHPSVVDFPVDIPSREAVQEVIHADD